MIQKLEHGMNELAHSKNRFFSAVHTVLRLRSLD